MAIDQLPIYSEEAEMSALGSAFLSPYAAEEILTMLSKEDFYRPAHQEIFMAMQGLQNAHQPIDLVTVFSYLQSSGKLERVGGENFLAQIAEYVPSPANAQFYAQIVIDKSTLRKLETAGREIIGLVRAPDEKPTSEKVDKAEQLVFEVSQRRLGNYFESLDKLTTDYIREIDHILDTGDPVQGIQTNFYDLDAKLGGLNGGDLIIVAARPSMGKTTFVLDLALRAAKQKIGAVAIFSLEMSSTQLTYRLVSMESGINAFEARKRDLVQQHYMPLSTAVETLHDLPIYIDQSSQISPLEMRGKCRRLKSEHELCLVMVDYLQLMSSPKSSENRVQEISDIARSLKAMSKELNIPVIALSQLNRAVELRENKRPQLSDIRESGAIEAEADVVMMIYREQYYRDREKPQERDNNQDRVEVAEINIAKHRNGDVGTVLLGFQPSYVRFMNLAAESKKAYREEMQSAEMGHSSRRGSRED